VAPHAAATCTTAGGGATDGPTRPTGIDKNRFKDAWDRVKDITVATSTAVAWPALAVQVDGLRAVLDALPASSLNADEQRLLADFNRVYWAYADSVTLWTAAADMDGDHGGIPVFEGGQPLVPRAAEIVATYGLVLAASPTDGEVQCVAEDSVDRLWEAAHNTAVNDLWPVFRR
jgi:hypothetical protein